MSKDSLSRWLETADNFFHDSNKIQLLLFSDWVNRMSNPRHLFYYAFIWPYTTATAWIMLWLHLRWIKTRNWEQETLTTASGWCVLTKNSYQFVWHNSDRWDKDCLNDSSTGIGIYENAETNRSPVVFFWYSLEREDTFLENLITGIKNYYFITGWYPYRSISRASIT